jgi:hypothetical protein
MSVTLSFPRKNFLLEDIIFTPETSGLHTHSKLAAALLH